MAFRVSECEEWKKSVPVISANYLKMRLCREAGRATVPMCIRLRRATGYSGAPLCKTATVRRRTPEITAGARKLRRDTDAYPFRTAPDTLSAPMQASRLPGGAWSWRPGWNGVGPAKCRAGGALSIGSAACGHLA